MTAQTRSNGHCPQSWQPIGISELEPAAWAALLDSGSTAVVAGPGSGKTEFLAQRATFLLQSGICSPPQRILAISYKRDSAGNLASRVEKRAPNLASRFVSQTFDAFTKGLFDRFRAALPPAWEIDGDYDLQFWNGRDQEDFLTELASSTAGPLGNEIYEMPTHTFLTKVVGRWQLPQDPSIAPTCADGYAAWSWWKAQYLDATSPKLDFVMMNRLVELLIRTRPHIARALRVTYPFVFVDEFQDTTAAQMTLLSTAFRGSAVVTAVGDRKQRIMGFAGALSDSFDEYERVFSATTYRLTWNFRSSPALVLLQQVIATRLDTSATQPISRAAAESGHVPIRLWSYDDPRREATHIAEWIARDVASSDRTASDFAMIVRQKPAEYEDRLKVAFALHGLKIRNDDAKYGLMSLQELTKNEVARLLLGILRLAAEPSGLAREWIEVTSTLGRVYGLDGDEAAARGLNDRLGTFTSDLRSWLESNPIGKVSADQVIYRAADFTSTDVLSGYVMAQHRGEDLEKILTAMARRLEAVSGEAQGWTDAFLAVEAVDAIPLLTVHKSKGLEYHTVLFLGLDGKQWWSFRGDTEEGLSAFFVGLSRAAQRLIFTCSKSGARKSGIAELYRLLDGAGVKEERIQSCES